MATGVVRPLISLEALWRPRLLFIYVSFVILAVLNVPRPCMDHLHYNGSGPQWHDTRDPHSPTRNCRQRSQGIIGLRPPLLLLPLLLQRRLPALRHCDYNHCYYCYIQYRPPTTNVAASPTSATNHRAATIAKFLLEGGHRGLRRQCLPLCREATESRHWLGKISWLSARGDPEGDGQEPRTHQVWPALRGFVAQSE